MELLALLLAFLLGTLIGPFIWVVLMPDVARRAAKAAEEAKTAQREAKAAAADAVLEYATANQQYQLAHGRFAEAIDLNERAQALIKQVAAQTAAAIEEQKPR